MATTEELAVFAYSAYRPSLQNSILIEGWEIDNDLSDPTRGSGFDGSVFVKDGANGPTEIVIAFRGTDGDEFTSSVPDWLLANVPAARGAPSPQVLHAIELVADTMAAYPGVPIALTGHSLGGGLASLMAMYFGWGAFHFDAAPFEYSALGVTIPLPPAPMLPYPSDLIQD